MYLFVLMLGSGIKGWEDKFRVWVWGKELPK